MRFAKLAGGLRLLISTAAPLVVSSASLLSARTAAYLVGFGLGSILSIWAPVILTLVSLTGSFGGGATDTSICDAYRAQLAQLEAINASRIAECNHLYEVYNSAYQAWLIRYIDFRNSYPYDSCDKICADDISGHYLCSSCLRDIETQFNLHAPVPPELPLCQQLEDISACGSESPPDCPFGKKVWLQVLWASPRGNASDSKGCFIVAYSQDSPDLPVDIEYNPFLKEQFVRSRAADWSSIIGNKLAGVDTTKWKDLNSTKGWDKGYWAAEFVDTECRGWRPGWSLKIK
ncbi:hypothetical protein [Microcoleus sp. S13_C3]|uniref:hypothetical protein n=1 Tax=Microcoleus sp. S13_C3 TaxID=3055409 RepID=UPI002FD42F56